MYAVAAVHSGKTESLLDPEPNIRRTSPTSVLGWDIAHQSDNPFPKRKLSSAFLSHIDSTCSPIRKLSPLSSSSSQGTAEITPKIQPIRSETDRPATKSTSMMSRPSLNRPAAIADGRTISPANTSVSATKSAEGDETRRYGKWVARKAKENAVVVVSSSSGCAMSHVVRKLLCSLGVSPMMVELQEDGNHDQAEIEAALIKELNSTSDENRGEQSNLIKMPFSKKQRISTTVNDKEVQGTEPTCSIPAVFIGGRLFGGVDKLLAAHINGTLVPQLKEAGALWL